ncbi:MAG: ABC transporter permease subunit [Chloroflexi bacterium]|nr:ABC transporter permease subunit [Chloroflexota bacterium]
MFRSVYTKTLRDLRWGILGWGLGLGALVVTTAVGWSIAYPDAQSRAALAAQLQGGLSVVQVFYGPPRNVDELGGFVEWRALGLAPVLLGLYLILAGTGMTRGAEESKAIEIVAATPRPRSRIMLQQAAALATALAMAVTLIGSLTVVSGVFTGDGPLSILRAAGTAANLAAAALLFGAIGLLFAQLFPRRRSAAFAAAGLMATFQMANTLPLAVKSLRDLRYISPLYLHTRSSPLANGNFDWPAFAGLLGLGLVIGAAALVLSQRRDLFDIYRPGGGAIPSGRPAEAAGPGRAGRAGGAFFRNTFGRAFRDGFGSTVAWTIGIGALTVLLTALTPNIREALLEQQNSAMVRQLERAGLLSERGILSVMLFSYLPPLAALFGVTFAASFAGDEVNQRLELELSTPVRRWSLFAQRLAAAATAQAVTIAVVFAATAVTVEASGVDVPMVALAAAMTALFVLAVCLLAFGFAVAAWKPVATAAIAAGGVAVFYFSEVLVPLLDLPGWARNVTPFGLFGQPLIDGLEPWRLAALGGIAAALGLAGAVQFQRKDVAK